MNLPSRDILDHFDHVHRLSTSARRALAGVLTRHSYTKNEWIQPPGSRCSMVYFVQTGAARIFYYKDGNDITEHFAFENELIVRAESLFTGQPTMKGIEALDDTTLIGIEATALDALYDRHHDIERLFRLLLEREHVHTLRRIESLQFQSATERYLDLLRTTDLVQKIPLKHIASYLGITQVSLSRIRASLRT